jgi:hypothetical protein
MADNENTFDELDEALNESFGLENSNEEIQEEQTIENTENDETTLEELMQQNAVQEQKQINSNDTNINNSQQNQEQPTNKSRGNNNSQDLIDANGNIIAKAGAERRFYEENVRLKRERDNFNQRVLPALRQNYDAMLNKVQAYENTFAAMKAGDLTNEDIQLGMELIREWKKSPQNTLNFLLTQAKRNGINIDSGSNSVNMEAINQMLDDKLKPFYQEREAAENEQRIQRESRQIYDNFMNKYPDAKIHTDELAYLVRKNPDESLDSIYYQLKMHYMQNGYDFNTPLAEILKQKQQTNNNNVGFNTRGVNQNINTTTISKPIASINMTYDQIIKDAMKQQRKG